MTSSEMIRNHLALGVALVSAALASACSDGFGLGVFGGGEEQDPAKGGAAADGKPSEDPIYDPADLRKEAHPDLFAGLNSGPEQTAAVCARGQDNRVTRGLCNGASITGVRDVLRALQIDFKNPNGRNAFDGNPGFALLANSSSLIARNVSAVNPRAIVFTPVPGLPQRLRGYTVASYTRGETFVEMASEDARTGQLTFYLLKFELGCEKNEGGCTNGDLFSPDVESNWKGFTLYDDSDLKNSILDCLSCHQPNRKAAKALLMRELRDPWTHWFRNDRPGGIQLLIDYKRVHGGEEYGGIPAQMIDKSDARALEDMIVGQGLVPRDEVVFQSKTIETEVQSSAPQQPAINTPPGTSRTWETLFQKSLAGQELPPPYHDVKVTDPDKLLFVSNKYVQMMNGQIEKSQLPDMRRVFLEDALSDLSFVPRKDATGKEILLHMCAQCHQPDLDQSISRAKFDMKQFVDGTMPKAERVLAVARMRMSSSDVLKMPPLFMRELPPEAIDKAEEALNDPRFGDK